MGVFPSIVPCFFLQCLKVFIAKAFSYVSLLPGIWFAYLKLLAWLSLDTVDTSADFFLGTFATGI